MKALCHNDLYYTKEIIDGYLFDKNATGLKSTTLKKSRVPLLKLYDWLGDDKMLTKQRLAMWIQHIEGRHYSKNTVNNYIKVINNLLRHFGYDELCIQRSSLGVDIRGRQFGYLTAIEPCEKRNRSNIVWKCRCKCGNEAYVPATLLINMNTTSCGCLKTEVLSFANRFVEGTSLTKMMNDNPKSTRAESGYTGVSAKGGKWQAIIQYKKVRHYLGSYSTVEEAAKARAVAMEKIMEDVVRLYEETDDLYKDEPHRPLRPKKIHKNSVHKIVNRALRDDNTSGCTGVTKQYGKWNVSIAYKGYRYRLGSYERLEDAIKIRKQAEEYLSCKNLDKLKEICTNINK